MKRFTSVEEFIAAQAEWQEALVLLRNILLQTELEEKIKWGFPCYTLNSKNVIGLGSFKSYCGLWFFQGVFLQDAAGVLVNAQEGKTKGMRQMRFASTDEINKSVVVSYIEEAIQNQKDGLEVKADKPSKEVILPAELSSFLATHTEYQSAFDNFTPGKQREFAEYIATAKREATKTNRLEKIKPMILDGVSLNDKYRK